MDLVNSLSKQMAQSAMVDQASEYVNKATGGNQKEFIDKAAGFVKTQLSNSNTFNTESQEKSENRGDDNKENENKDSQNKDSENKDKPQENQSESTQKPEGEKTENKSQDDFESSAIKQGIRYVGKNVLGVDVNDSQTSQIENYVKKGIETVTKSTFNNNNDTNTSDQTNKSEGESNQFENILKKGLETVASSAFGSKSESNNSQSNDSQSNNSGASQVESFVKKGLEAYNSYSSSHKAEEAK